MREEGGQIRLSQFVKLIPFGNRVLIIIISAMWALDFPGLTSKILMNDPLQFWSPNYQLWRVLTASFCLNSLFQVLVAFINLYTFYPKLEFKTSTLSILSNFFVTGLIIQIIYTILYLILPTAISSRVAHGDFCGIWFNLVFKYCYFNKQSKIKLCCFPAYIPKIAYPFVLLAFIMLINFSIKLDSLVGILIGFIECMFLSATIIQCKSDLCLSPLSKFSSWVPASPMSAGNQYIGLEQQVQVPRWSQSTKESNYQDYFKNKKGVKLGEG